MEGSSSVPDKGCCAAIEGNRNSQVGVTERLMSLGSHQQTINMPEPLASKSNKAHKYVHKR